MKTASANFIAAIDSARILTGARALFYENRLRFNTVRDISHTDSGISGEYGDPMYYLYDCAKYGNGILRVMTNTSDGHLYTQWIPNPRQAVTNWGHWIDTGRVVMNGHKPSVFDNRVFWQRSDGAVMYGTYNTGTNTISGDTVIYNYGTTDIIGIAAVSIDDIYVRINVLGTGGSGEEWDRAYIDFWDDVDGSPARTQCPNIHYGDFANMYGFTAVRKAANIDIIFFAGDKGKRAECIIRDATAWSMITPVLELDITDEQATFCPQCASLINGSRYLTMTVTRNNGTAYNAFLYSKLKDATFDQYFALTDWSFGRDSFISVVSSSNPGKLLYLYNDGDVDHAEIYYLGYNTCIVADSVEYVETQITTLSTSHINDLSITIDKNNPAVFQAYIGSNVSSNALIAMGNDVELYVSYNNEEMKIGTYTIDSVYRDKGDTGTICTIAGRGAGLKKLSMWTSDAYYDIWSQTKQSCIPIEMKEVIRMSGTFSQFDPGWVTHMIVEEMNTDGIAYSAMKACKNTVARARFTTGATSSTYTPQFGVLLNLYRHPLEEGDSTQTYSALLARVEGTQIALYHINHSVFTSMATIPYTTPASSTLWIEMEYYDGNIIVKRRLNTETEWTIAITDRFEINALSPFGTTMRDGTGRPGLYLRNATQYSTTPGFPSDATVVPVNNAGAFTPASGYILVDSESISYTKENTNVVTYDPARDKTVVSGNTFMNAPHNNANWVDGEIAEIPMASPELVQNLCYNTATNYISWTFTIDGTVTLDSVTVRLRRVGSPTQNVYLYLATTAWDDGGAPNPSAVFAEVNIAYGGIGTSFDYELFTFAAPQTLTAGTYFLVLSNVNHDGTPTVNTSNYYQVSVQEDNDYDAGAMYLGGSFAARSPIALPAYILTGESNNGNGYEIYFAGNPLSTARNWYNGCALVGLSGAGKGAVLKVTDFDYQAPDQWVPSRQYVPPDRWQDHVGDLSHGAWVTTDLFRYFVDRDPSGLLAPGSVLGLYPGLSVVQRGYNSTAATSHSSTTVSYWDTDNSVRVRVSKFEYYSMDMDWRLEDIFFKIARRAGLHKYFTPQKEYYTTINVSGAGLVTSRLLKHNTIIKLTVPQGGNRAIVNFRYAYSGGQYVNGKGLHIDYTYISLRDSSGTLIFRTTFPNRPVGEWVTVSIQDDDYCVWFMDRLIFSYHDTTVYPEYGDYTWISTDGVASFALDWSACDYRVDNFIMDAGIRGDQLISQLIGQKRFYFLDTVDGGIRLFRDTTTVSGTYALTALAGTGTSEQDMVTRLRVLGLYEYETFNAQDVVEYGNIYAEANVEDCDTYEESIIEAQKILEDYKRKKGQHSLIGAADPRIEPMDVITYNTGASNVQTRVETISFVLNIGDEDVSFDMKLEGIDV